MSKKRYSRRDMLTTMGGLGMSSALGLGCGGKREAAAGKVDWTRVADVVVVGTGAAGFAAAVTARSLGDEVLMIESEPVPGGTTMKSGGVYWIPNNPGMQAAGLADPRDEALAYMARVAFPFRYDPDAPALGLPRIDHEIIEAFYDNGSAAIEHFARIGALRSTMLPPYKPDYWSHFAENVAPFGRPMVTLVDGEPTLGGANIIAQMKRHADEHGIGILTDHRARTLLTDGQGRLLGLEVAGASGPLTIGARKAAVFATGGFAQNRDYARRFLRGPIWGSCAGSGSRGDILDMALSMGASLGNMSAAWFHETRLFGPEFQDNTYSSQDASCVVVNRSGKRVFSEHQTYDARGRVHFNFDAQRYEYPNKILFEIYDTERETSGDGDERGVVRGATLRELAVNLSKELERYREFVGPITLAPDFAAELERTVARFNEYARTGKDLEFGRGEALIERWWYDFNARDGESLPDRMLPIEGEGRPNRAMRAFVDRGPYFARLLGAACLDTCGGPRINARAQLIDARDRPLGRLYGAGNCIAAPSANGYWASGGTLGPALAFGYIAGKSAHEESRQDLET